MNSNNQENIQSSGEMSEYDIVKNEIIQLKIRDFIYMDIERLKSIISQLEKGVVDTLRTISKEMINDLSWVNQTVEAKSFHDYIYNKVEEHLLANKQLINIPGNLENQEDIKYFRNNLSDTSFVLLKGRVNINDFAQMRLYLENINDLANFISKCSLDSLPESISKDERKKRLTNINDMKKALPDKVTTKGLKQFFDQFYKDRVVIKMLPFKDYHDFRLAGNLNNEFLRDDISSIIYKYGTAPVSKWTIFAQVASIPDKDRENTYFSPSGGEIEVALQRIFDSLRQFEILAQSVVYPEIAITPIAIYRE